MIEEPPTMATAPTPTLTHLGLADPEEVAYWERRKVVRRRVLAVVLLGLVLTLGFGAYLFASHVMTTWWLEINQYVVFWSVDRDNWKQGGSTSVRYSAGPSLFRSEHPVRELRFLGHLRGLEELDLAILAGVVDADLAGLDGQSHLRRLNLDRSLHPSWVKLNEFGLTDATLARIGRLPRLIDLNLGGQEKLTDAGFGALSGLGELRSLDLSQTEITDAGLARLKALPALKSLNLKGTKVSVAGVNDFEASRPGVVVLFDPPPPVTRSKTPR